MYTLLSSINSDSDLIYIFIRAIFLFLISIFIIRFGNHRFNLNTPLDFLFVVILGGIISRGVNGTSSLVSTLVGAAGIILTHKILAKAAFKFTQVDYLVKGKSHLIICNGMLQQENLKKFNITEEDILEQLHQQLNTANYKHIHTAYLERTGQMTFIKGENV